MRVLFYEPNHTGHHFFFLARMLPGFLELPVEYSLATTTVALKSEEFAKTLKPFEDRLELLPVCRPKIRKAPLRNAWRRVADLSRAVDQWNPDHVCVVYADGMWQPLAMAQLVGKHLLRKGPTYEAWMYRGRFAYPEAKGFLQRRRRELFRQLLKQGLFSKIHFDDELVLNYVESLSPTQTQVVLPANPVKFTDCHPTEESRRTLGLPANDTIISCLGMIDHRKGAHLAIQAFAHLADRSVNERPIKLLLAGPHSHAIEELLAEEPWLQFVESGQIISINRYLSDQDMADCSAASDLLLAPYPNHSGRSSIVLWAASAGKPVVAVDRGCIRYVVETEQLGDVCDVQDLPTFADTIIERLEAAWTEEDRRRVRKYAQWHSIEHYQEMCSELVRQRASKS